MLNCYRFHDEKNNFFTFLFSLVEVKAQSVTELNNCFSTYSHNIKTNNFYNPNSSSCIYESNYMNAQIQAEHLFCLLDLDGMKNTDILKNVC